MSEVKVSLICTVYNEGKSIRELLDSVIDQTRQPDEAILVDGGSEDGTREIIEEYAEKHGWINLVVEEGCNIAEGRNTAIENASHDYIISTDGGCVLDEEWIESMLEAFEEGYDALTGIWRPKADTLFEFVQGEIRGHHLKPENIPNNHTPSSRSAGFTRQVWADAGKYPEYLYTGEDSEFNTNVREAGYEWQVVDDAVVYWDMRSSWKSYFKQFYRYGEGDAQSQTEYPEKVFGISKTVLRLTTTVIGGLGLFGALISPWLVLLAMAGFGPQYASKTGSLKSSIRQRGLRTVPYWLVMIPFESIAFTLGYFRQKLWF